MLEEVKLFFKIYSIINKLVIVFGNHCTSEVFAHLRANISEVQKFEKA